MGCIKLNEWGKVVGLKGKTAILSIQKSDECEKCRKCRPGRGEMEMIAEAKNKAGAQIGDTVEVSDHIISWYERLLIEAGIPVSDGIIGGIVGYMLAKFINNGANKLIWITAVGILFMVISYMISKKKLIEITKLKTKKLIVSSIIHKEG